MARLARTTAAIAEAASGQGVQLPAGRARAGDGRSWRCEIANANGKVKAIRLVAAASTHVRLIGPPSDPGSILLKMTNRKGGYV